MQEEGAEDEEAKEEEKTPKRADMQNKVDNLFVKLK